jgi:hypothetical protein
VINDKSRTETNPNGVFILTDLQPGVYDVKAFKEGYSETVKVGVDVSANTTTVIELTLSRTIKLPFEILILVIIVIVCGVAIITYRQRKPKRIAPKTEIATDEDWEDMRRTLEEYEMMERAQKETEEKPTRIG